MKEVKKVEKTSTGKRKRTKNRAKPDKMADLLKAVGKGEKSDTPKKDKKEKKEKVRWTGDKKRELKAKKKAGYNQLSA